MRLILTVFDAIGSFGRPCTCRELQRETGLSKDDVWKGLRGLKRRQFVDIVGTSRQRMLFSLREDAIRPIDARGSHLRTSGARRNLALAMLRHYASRPSTRASVDAFVARHVSWNGAGLVSHSLAAPASHRAAPALPSPGAPGERGRPMIAATAPLEDQPSCLLEQFWPRRCIS